MSYTQELTKKQLISPPGDVVDQIQYEVLTGSVAYAASDDTSDMDIQGWTIPSKASIFPHIDGHIAGFGPPPKKNETYHKAHIFDASALGGKGRTYDLTIYSVVEWFNLMLLCNPNMIEMLYVPNRCVLHSTMIAEMVRSKRKLFLHKGCYDRFRSYAASQLHKLKTKEPKGKRKELVDKFGLDTKFAYNVVRLSEFARQILEEGDLDIERPRELLKSVRRGEWTVDKLDQYFDDSERLLLSSYERSTLPATAPIDEIKKLLLDVLEQHFGNLKDCVSILDPSIEAIIEIEALCRKARIRGNF